jgi:hypothetical protein
VLGGVEHIPTELQNTRAELFKVEVQKSVDNIDWSTAVVPPLRGLEAGHPEASGKHLG